MTPERYERLCELFDRAQATPPDRRAALVKEVGAADPTLAAELQSMLADDEKAQGEGLFRGPCPVNAKALLPDEQATVVRAPPADSDDERPEVKGYCLDGGQLGAGGMGVVWLGRDTRLHRAVAVKVMRHALRGRPQLARRYVEEAQVASQLAHPAIPPVHELGTLPDGRPYFVMKLVRGRTLAALLDARASPADDLPRLLGIFEQVCQGLAYAHSKRVIHRDLKPANVMVGAFGEVQVMDWGLAKVLGPGEADEERPGPVASVVRTARSAGASGELGSGTEVGAVLGTPSYMAPEQARGEVDGLDERADVFGLGAILCDILTGQPPFAGSAAGAMARARAGAVTDALSRLDACGADADLLALAKSCLAPEPAGRPRDGAAVASAVAAYVESVRERLRRAALERAAAEARAEEEARTRAVAEAKAAVERRARRLAVGLAAALLGLLAAGAGGGLLAQHLAARRDAEQARHEAQQRQAVESALDRAAALRQQTRWGEAAAVLEQARGVLGDAGPDDLRQRLAGAEAELALVNRLDTIRQRQAIVVEGRYDKRKVARDYAVAFREAGLGAVGEDEAAAAERVRASGVAGPLVAALDVWATMTDDAPSRSWLLAVARGADPRPWGERLRDPAVWQDRRALRALADDLLRDGGARLGGLSPQLLAVLGGQLGGAEALPLLRAAQRRYPGDFWLNLGLGTALMDAGQVREAVGYYRAAVALRPEACAAHTNLGVALQTTRDVDGALAEFRTAIELEPRFALAYNNLGVALRDKNDLEGAIAAYQNAVQLDPEYARAYYNLGNALSARKDMEGAGAAYQKAIECNPRHAYAHTAYGDVLVELGRFAEARTEFQRCLELLPERDAWRAIVGRSLQKSERLVALESRLPAVLSAADEPADGAERLARAQLCQYKRYYATAARLYAAAFAADPRLGDDLDARDRYAAAMSAVRAAAGRGLDAGHLSDSVAATLRHQALGWLRADLALHARQAEGNDFQAKLVTRVFLVNWRQNPDFAAVRDAEALDRLPDDERRAWRQLWEEVGRLLQKADARP